MKVIYVYNNRDAKFSTFPTLWAWCKIVFSNPLVRVDVIDSDSLDKLQQKSAAALFMPGGSSRAFQAQITSAKAEVIRRFLSKGGILSTSCGSVYWLSKELFFDRWDVQFTEPTNSGDFVVFDGLTKGPIQQISPGKFRPSLENIIIYPIVTSTGQRINVYYHGGPEFIGDTNFIPTAYYANTNIAASGYKEVGAGYCFMSGYHIEFNGETLKPFSDFQSKKGKQNGLDKLQQLPDKHDLNIIRGLYPQLFQKLEL